MKHWIDLRAINRINRHFAVIIDSDKKSPEHNINGKKLNWKRKCEEQGGKFFILRKRSIENYINPKAITRSDLEIKDYHDFSDMKDLFGIYVYKLINNMSSDEILEMDKYNDKGIEHHELKEIIESIIKM